jgi:hypothetical protein
LHALLHAIDQHDHGWSLWDDAPLLKLHKTPQYLNPVVEAPHLNPTAGVPRSFMEMRMRDSTAIWTQSIAFCSVDPLAGIGVSRHFCYLANQVKTSRADGEDCQAIERFLDQQARLEADLAPKAHSYYGAAKTVTDLERLFDFAFQTVRFFDGVSLWLCCAERHEPERMTAPTGETVTFIPKEATRIVIDPYPLGVDSLRLSTPARRVSARKYVDEGEYQVAFNAAPVETLTWTIHPA